MPNHHPFLRRWLAAMIVLAGAFSGVVRGEEPAGRFEVHELSLWIVDGGAELANPRSIHPSALPATVNSVRPAPSSLAARRAAPISLITFHGQPTPNLDVDLRTSAGSFLAHWPLGEGMPNHLRWVGTPALNLVDKIDDQSELVFVEQDDWIAKLRGGDALYVKRGARAERFLAYDVELKFAAPLVLDGGPDKYKVVNISDRPLYDVLIARATPEGCRVAWIDVLPPTKLAPPVAPPRQDAPKPNVPGKPPLNLFSDAKSPPAAEAKPPNTKLFGGLPKTAQAKPADAKDVPANAGEKAKAANAEAQTRVEKLRELAIAKARAAAAQARATSGITQAPVAVPAGQPDAAPKPPVLFGGLPAATTDRAVEVTLSEPLASLSPESAAKTTQSLAERLVKAGLSAHEAESFVDHYRALVFEGQALVVACRLDAAVMDEKIPLSVFPAPSKIVRVGMVLLRNADPQLGQEVDKLIAQLGEKKFSVREAAHQQIMEMGPLAFASLNKALNHADPEIAIRCERILLSQGQQLGAQVPAEGNRLILQNGRAIQVAPPVPVRAK